MIRRFETKYSATYPTNRAISCKFGMSIPLVSITGCKSTQTTMPENANQDRLSIDSSLPNYRYPKGRDMFMLNFAMA